MEHAHYFALLMWVFGNMLWAGGEIFDPLYDTPYALLDVNPISTRTARWYSSWVLVAAYTSIVVMYGMWIYIYVTKGPDGESIIDSEAAVWIEPEDNSFIYSRASSPGGHISPRANRGVSLGDLYDNCEKQFILGGVDGDSCVDVNVPRPRRVVSYGMLSNSIPFPLPATRNVHLQPRSAANIQEGGVGDEEEDDCGVDVERTHRDDEDEDV